MPLLDLKTDLKSLKYGNDRRGGGNSRQPFITTDIPEGYFPATLAPDFLLRNGFLNPVNSATDSLRISKFFTTISGINFIAKQQALILTNPLSLGGRSAGPLRDQLDIAYNPLQTIAQVAGNSIGFHTERTGLLPDTNNFTKKYEYLQTFEYNRNDEGKDNRLVNLYRNIIRPNDGKEVSSKSKLAFGIDTEGLALFKYIGGPNISVVGGGNTLIKRYSVTNNPYQSFPFSSGSPRPLEINYKSIIIGSGASADYIDAKASGEGISSDEINSLGGGGSNSKVFNENGDLLFTPNVYIPGTLDVDTQNLERKKVGPYEFEGDDLNKLGASRLYSSSLRDIRTEDGTVFISDFVTNEDLGFNGNNKVDPDTVYVKGEFPKTNQNVIQQDKTSTLDQEQLMSTTPAKDGSTAFLEDFRKRASANTPSSFKPAFEDYEVFNRNSTYLSGDPGKRSVRRIDYNIGPQDIIEDIPSTAGQDQINLYEDKSRNETIEQGDLIQFNMRIINNDSLQDEFIYWRAFIDDFSENYQGQWGDYQYVGRGQKFYRYKGFERSFSLSFTVHAQSRAELLPMWKKLNRMASVTAPDYSGGGFMRGSILKLTVGDYITNHPGILEGFSVGNMFDFGFEVARDSEGKRITDLNNIQQLPMGFKVTGFNFKSISGGGFSSSNYIPGKGASFVGLGLGS